MKGEDVIFRVHAVQRMFERNIGVEDVRKVLSDGVVIEDYPDDTPYPSRLVLGWCEGRPIHVVAAHNAEDNSIIVVTVYEPDSDQWDLDSRRRRR
jgi:hypothetical protein